MISCFRARLWIVVAVLALGSAGFASAQQTESRIAGRVIDSSDAALPVQLGLRFRRLDAPDALPTEARVPLPKAVKPGESVAIPFDIRWPEAPGRYRVTLDLVLEDVAWFAERVGEPIASVDVTVSPASP